MAQAFRFKKAFNFTNSEYICTIAQKYYFTIIECIKNNFIDEIQRIIVFGSSLGLEFTRYSDLDFIVIVKNHTLDSTIKKMLVRTVFERNTDILLLTQEEYETLEKTSPLFYSSLKERSQIIYEK